MVQPYAGKYLQIDLTTREVRTVPIDEADARTYLLGSGYAAKLYAEVLDPAVPPFDPCSPLYIFNGLLTGTFAPAAGRSCWCGRSPLTGIWGESNVGGHIGAELRAAGVDGVVLTGAAPQPVYLYIHDGEVEFRDATHLWGLDTFEAYDRLIEETDPKARAALIGPAGERQVLYAAVMQGGQSHSRAAGRDGLGALLASKRVKAIAARGQERPTYADPDAFREVVSALIPLIKEGSKGMARYGTGGGMTGCDYLGDLPIHNWAGGSWPEGAQAISGQVMREHYWTRDTFCFACPIGCGKAVAIKKGPYAGVSGEGPEYETLAGFGSLLELADWEAIARANDLCNRLGLDTISTSGVIAFAIEAFEHGLIPLDDLGGVPLAWGEPEGILSLIPRIATREGAGTYLADGVRRAAQHLGHGSEVYAVHVKGLEMAYHDPRACLSMAANYATANRGACHLEGLTYWAMYGLDVRDWAPEPYDGASVAGAGRNAIAFQDYLSLFNPLGLCKFVAKTIHDQIPALINTATGWGLTDDEVWRIGARVFNLKRVLNNRLGITRADDTLPERLLTQARPSGLAAGRLPDLAAMLEEYYAARGWLPDGRPSPETLAALGLEGV